MPDVFYETEGLQHGGGYDMGISLRNPSKTATVTCTLFVFNEKEDLIYNITLLPKQVEAFMLSSIHTKVKNSKPLPEGFYQSYLIGPVTNTVWLMRNGDVQAQVKIPTYG